MGIRSGTVRLVVCALVLCVVACDDGGARTQDSGPDAAIASDTACPPTLVPHGPACIPKLDECPGNQVPVPGGGCKKIGVEECSVDGVPGIVGPPDWTCQRIGVQECTVDGNPGIKGPPDWTCKPVGIPFCVKGWKRVKDWCEPILPPARCPAGSIALIGHSTCQPMGDCGTGTWGTLQTTPKTIFVDQAHTGPVFDGSQDNPFASIGAALAAAGRDARVVVAAGTYNEDLVITTPVKLEGRCAQRVRAQPGRPHHPGPGHGAGAAARPAAAAQAARDGLSPLGEERLSRAVPTPLMAPTKERSS